MSYPTKITFRSRQVFEGKVDNNWPCINISNPETKTLKNKNKIVAPENIVIVFDYPLKDSFEFKFTNPNGFSRLDLINTIVTKYKQIYDEEDNSVGDPGYIEGMYNRKQSDGPYGIYGHYITDLDLIGIVLKNGKYYLQVES
jgi:hypothetical protein